jgi:putative Mg2+ transporter-C (MgtC) family protein
MPRSPPDSSCSNDLNGTGRVRVTAHLTALHRIDAEVEKIVGRISLEPTITAARWEAQAHLDPESPSALGH